MNEELKLTEKELQKLIYCIDLIIQNFGENKGLNELADKLIKMKELEDNKKRKTLTSKCTSKKTHGEYQNVKLTEKEFQTLIDDYGEEKTKQLITYLDEYIEMKGYKAKSHYLCIKRWVIEAVTEKQNKYNRKPVREEKLPDWFDKEIKSTPLTEEEKKELEELEKMLKNF